MRRDPRAELADIDRASADIAEIKASLLVLKRMTGVVLAFVVALAWRVFQ